MSLTDRAIQPAASSDSDGGSRLLKFHRIVVKAGTAILSGGGEDTSGVDLAALGGIVNQVCRLREMGAEVLLVTSGAIAVGRAALGRAGPVSRDIRSRQVAAAVGQGRLMQIYQEQFAVHGVTVAQALLTIGDLSDRQSYLNVRNTLHGLLELGVVPLLNENDVVAVDEIGAVFGDNDRLSALVANLVDADLLLILTDIDGLYTADPRVDPTATLIPFVERVDESIEAVAGRHLQPWARGGMPTKLEAARLVTSSGIPMIMAHGREDGSALRAACGEPVGTFFQGRRRKNGSPQTMDAQRYLPARRGHCRRRRGLCPVAAPPQPAPRRCSRRSGRLHPR